MLFLWQWEHVNQNICYLKKRLSMIALQKLKIKALKTFIFKDKMSSLILAKLDSAT